MLIDGNDKAVMRLIVALLLDMTDKNPILKCYHGLTTRHYRIIEYLRRVNFGLFDYEWQGNDVYYEHFLLYKSQRIVWMLFGSCRQILFSFSFLFRLYG